MLLKVHRNRKKVHNMPTYEYICDGCQHEFESFESIKSDPQTTCPACEKPQLRRKIGPGAAILFKGSGFYITDYRSESYRAKAKADTPPSGGEKSKSESSSSSGSDSSSKPASGGPSA
jgi:putative FmdB family regulatory protein